MQANVNKALNAVRKAQDQHAVYLAEVAKLRKGLPRSADKGRVVLLPMVEVLRCSRGRRSGQGCRHDGAGLGQCRLRGSKESAAEAAG